MEGEVDVFGIHGPDKHPDGVDHHNGVACLDGDYYVGEIVADGNAKEFHGAFYHSGWCVAVAAHYAVRQRAVVNAYAYCSVMLPTQFEEWAEGVFYLLELACIFFIGVFEFCEHPARIDEVARIDAHLFNLFCCGKGRFGVEVDVGNQGDCVTGLTEAVPDFTHAFGFAHTLGGEAVDVGSRFCDAYGLGNGVIDVGCRGVVHRL